MIELRSDTIPPSDAMRQAMADAATGDELFGEDPTSRALEERVAELLGKERALFVPTATMGNALAVLVQCPAEGHLLLDVQSHLYRREREAPAVLERYQTDLFDTPDGCPDAGFLAHGCEKRGGRTLLCLETTHTWRRGLAVPLERLQAAEVVRRQGGAIHLDGARLFNAAVALRVAPREIAATADTVVLSLCKALGAPAGAVLAGPDCSLAAARELRLRLGGTLRQTGILAAAGVLALQPGWEAALARDHVLAQRLAQALSEVAVLGIQPEAFETNMVLFRTEPLGIPGDELARRAATDGVRVGLLAPNLVRLVTHRSLSEVDVDRAAAVLVRVAREAIGSPRRSMPLWESGT